jgi:RND family efflux transporter MFP subunit
MKHPSFTLMLLVAAALAACSRPEPAPEPVRAVRTLTVAAESAGGVHEYAAEVRARTESRLSFRVAGKMVKRQAEVGQRVKAGDVLAQLDPEDLRLAQAAAAATVQSARVNFELAEADYKRYKGLLDQGFISAADLDRRDSTLKAAKAQLEQAQAQASVQGNQATYSVLMAPAAGVITGIDAEPGAVLAAGAPVLRLALDGPRDVVFSVPEDSLARVRPLLGKAGALRVRPWGAQKALPATVREIAAAADAATRTFLVKADVGNADLQLGQTASVLLDTPRLDGVTKLPLTAVMQQQGQTAVWVLDKTNMTVRVQPVVVAGAEGNAVVVASGLSAGQVVVTAGVHVLTPGQRVKYFEATTASPPTPAASDTSAAAR